MGAKSENYSSQGRVFKARKTTARECASRGSTSSLYRADCAASCGPNTLHLRGACVVCGAGREKQPKVARRFKPAPVAVASVAGEAWAETRRCTPSRREGRGRGLARA